MSSPVSVLRLALAPAIAVAIGACGGHTTGNVDDAGAPDENVDDARAPDGNVVGTFTCEEAAAAICNAPAGCGPADEMSLQSCNEGMVWVSVDTCISMLTANCGPNAAATPLSPSIQDPDACSKALPFACAHGQAVIPASCVTCVAGPADAG
jgi:hypothetical protein